MNNQEEQNKRGSGGDGGKVFIFAREIKGNGKILADGGDGSVGGKGGEVHIVAEKNDYTGEVSAKGGKSDVIPSSIKKKKWSSERVPTVITQRTVALIK